MARPESCNRSLRVCDPAYKYFIPTCMKDKGSSKKNKVLFLVARPLRGGWDKGLATKKK